MSKTTVRLPDDLKKHLAIVAEQVGTTPRARILQAIADRASAVVAIASQVGIVELTVSEPA